MTVRKGVQGCKKGRRCFGRREAARGDLQGGGTACMVREVPRKKDGEVTKSRHGRGEHTQRPGGRDWRRMEMERRPGEEATTRGEAFCRRCVHRAIHRVKAGAYRPTPPPRFLHTRFPAPRRSATSPSSATPRAPHPCAGPSARTKKITIKTWEAARRRTSTHADHRRRSGCLVAPKGKRTLRGRSARNRTGVPHGKKKLFTQWLGSPSFRSGPRSRSFLPYQVSRPL